MNMPIFSYSMLYRWKNIGIVYPKIVQLCKSEEKLTSDECNLRLDTSFAPLPSLLNVLGGRVQTAGFTNRGKELNKIGYCTGHICCSKPLRTACKFLTLSKKGNKLQCIHHISIMKYNSIYLIVSSFIVQSFVSP